MTRDKVVQLLSEARGELIAIDGYDHYPMHFEALEAAAG
jgi:hypothetical protein